MTDTCPWLRGFWSLFWNVAIFLTWITLTLLISLTSVLSTGPWNLPSLTLPPSGIACCSRTWLQPDLDIICASVLSNWLLANLILQDPDTKQNPQKMIRFSQDNSLSTLNMVTDWLCKSKAHSGRVIPHDLFGHGSCLLLLTTSHCYYMWKQSSDGQGCVSAFI